MDGFSRGNPRTGLPVLVQHAWRAHGLLVASCSVQQLMILAFRVLGGRSGLSRMILLMYLIVMFSKPLEISNGLVCTWFCESNWNLFENVQEHEILRNSFFSSEMIELRFTFCSNNFKMVLKGVCEL